MLADSRQKTLYGRATCRRRQEIRSGRFRIPKPSAGRLFIKKLKSTAQKSEMHIVFQ